MPNTLNMTSCRITLLGFCLSMLAACALPPGATWCNSGGGICEADGVTRWTPPEPWAGAAENVSGNGGADDYTPPEDDYTPPEDDDTPPEGDGTPLD